MLKRSKSPSPYNTTRTRGFSFTPEPIAHYRNRFNSSMLTTKYRLLPEISNNNQLIIKDISSKEYHIRDQWERRISPPAKPRVIHSPPPQTLPPKGISGGPGPNSSRESKLPAWRPAEDTLRFLSKNGNKFYTNLQFPKTKIRTNTYDPIMGSERNYAIPKIRLASLDINGASTFYSHDFHRLGGLYKGNKCFRS